MLDGCLQRLKARIGPAADDTTDRSVTDGGQRTRLFACRECNSTYISVEMESCPECGDGLERIPNERDLGLA